MVSIKIWVLVVDRLLSRDYINDFIVQRFDAEFNSIVMLIIQTNWLLSAEK